MKNSEERYNELRNKYLSLQVNYQKLALKNMAMIKDKEISFNINALQIPMNSEEYKNIENKVNKLQKRCKKLEKIVKYGKMSTIETLVSEIQAFIRPQVDKLTKEMIYYSCVKHDQDVLRDFLEYLKELEVEIKELILFDIDNDKKVVDKKVVDKKEKQIDEGVNIVTSVWNN